MFGRVSHLGWTVRGLTCRRFGTARCVADLPDIMRGVEIRVVGSGGGPEALEIRQDLPVPECKEDDVLIKVAAAGVNRPDVLQRKGVYPPPPGHSPLPGLEVSGKVVCVGANVERFRVGDEVCALANGGGYAEYCAVPSWQCLPVPKGLSLIEAAGVPETFFTVYHVLFDQTNIFQEHVFSKAKGNNPRVLFHGGTSGIGLTAIQLAREFGATQIFTTVGSEEKRKFLEDHFGSTCHAINYKDQDFEEVVQTQTNKEGIDFVLDMVAGEYINKNLKLLKMQGRLAVIGSLGSPIAPQVDMRLLMRHRLTIGGSTIRAQTRQVKESIATNLEKLVWPLVESKSINVFVSPQSVFDMKRAQDAHRLMESSKHVGKIVLTMDT